MFKFWLLFADAIYVKLQNGQAFCVVCWFTALCCLCVIVLCGVIWCTCMWRLTLEFIERVVHVLSSLVFLYACCCWVLCGCCISMCLSVLYTLMPAHLCFNIS